MMSKAVARSPAALKGAYEVLANNCPTAYILSPLAFEMSFEDPIR